MPGGRLKKVIGGDVLANVSLGRRGWGVAFAWTLLWWAADITCLAVAFLAVGGALQWRALLIAYAAGQLAGMLPITPGGLGVTEGSMAVTLAAYGGGMATAVAAVLLYRLITYWAVLPAGGLCYLSLRRRHSLVIPAPATGADTLAAVQPTRLAGHAGTREDQGNAPMLRGGKHDGVTDPDQACRYHRSVDAEAALMTPGDRPQDAPVARKFLLGQR